MLGGGRVPARHDGMAVTMEGDALVLLRNHELDVGDPIIGKNCLCTTTSYFRYRKNRR